MQIYSRGHTPVDDAMISDHYSCVQKRSEGEMIPATAPKKFRCFYRRERETAREEMWNFVRLWYEIPFFSRQVINSTWVVF